MISYKNSQPSGMSHADDFHGSHGAMLKDPRKTSVGGLHMTSSKSLLW